MRVPQEIQDQIVKWSRLAEWPKGSEFVDLESLDRSWRFGGWTSSTLTKICFLPWNRNQRPLRAGQRTGKRND